MGCIGGGNAPPCAADDVSCSPRDVSDAYLMGNELLSGAAFGLQIDPPSVEEVLERGPDALGLSPVHLAVRATAQPGSIRCDWHGVARTPERREDEIRFLLGVDDDAALPSASEIRRLFMYYVDRMSPPFRPQWTANVTALVDGGVSAEYLFLTCYVDYTVQEYLLGNGPAVLTVAYGKMDEGQSYDLYNRSFSAGGLPSSSKLSEAEFAAAHQGASQDAESWLSGIVEGRESVVFLAPLGAHGTIVVEAWQAVEQWDLQTDAADTVHAVRYGVFDDDPEHTQTLANLNSRITTAASSDAHASTRIANVSGLTQYYRDIGAYSDITPDDGSTDTFTPAQPPPVLTCAGGTAITDTTADRALVHDCEALLDGKDTLRGTATLDWGVDSAITGWEGVTVAGTPSRVTKLLLSGESLSGTIPADLGRLFELTHLNLSSNSLTGSIPRELGLLYNLQEIRLSGNSLTGCIPVALKDVPTNDLSSLNLLYCAPPAPEGLTVSSSGETSVSLSWTAVSNTSKYRVEYRPLYSGNWVLDDETITATTRKVDGLSCGREYLFRVSAYGSGTTYAAAWSEPSEYLRSMGGECVPPTFGAASYAFSLPGDAEVGTVVGSVSATGSQTDDTVTYSITGGDEGGNFAIDSSSGRITVAGDLTSHVGTSFSLTVEASDTSGGSAAVTVTVAVTKTCDSGTAVPNPTSNAGLVADCNVLLGLRDELAGTGSLNWSADLALSSWEGVTTGGTPRRVTRLRLERKSLTGSVPAALGDVPALRALHLGHNRLTGAIPGALGGLTNLTSLGLESNRLTGPVPVELGALTNLGLLYLYDNSLTGPIPAETGNLRNLDDLFLQDNALSGPIPPEIGNIAGLVRVWLSGNRLSGTIPAELTGLTRLTLLVLSGNNLVGCVPPSLKDIRTNDLDSLGLSDCLAGPPAPVGLSASLAEDTFTLSWTALSGADEYEVQWQIAGAVDSWAALPAVTAAEATYAPAGGPECSSTYEFRVRAHGDGHTYPTHWGMESVSVSAASSSCPPSFDEASYVFEVAEDAGIDVAVGTVSATDPDADDEVSYAITAGNGDGKFSIGDGTGEITLAATLDHETADTYTLTVEASDGAGGTDTATVTVTVTDVQEDPSFDEASYSFEVPEDAAAGDAAGTVSATDPDENDTVGYAITAGNGDGKFSIGDGTGEITLAATLDHETADTYTLTVEASDGEGGTDTTTVTVTVTDVAEAPVFGEASYSFEVGEDAAMGDAVGTVSAADPDDGDEVSYSITAGNDDGKFAIDGGTGEITLAETLDHETADSYTLTVEASDGEGGTDTATVAVTVTDVAEAPSFDAASYFFLVRDTAAVDSVVGTVSASDPDDGDELNYSITAGNDDGKFSISASTGRLTLAETLDISDTPSYSLTVEAADGRGGKDTVEVAMAVTIAECYNGTAVPRADVQPRLVRDCSVLLTLKDALRGTASLNWSPDRSINDWQGIFQGAIPIRDEEGSYVGRIKYVRDIVVSGRGLNGSIPPLLSGLVDLRRLDLDDNALTGGIPGALGQLASLELLYLHGNHLTGNIPSELGNLAELQILSLAINDLTGNIPPELGKLTNLRQLLLDDNDFTGQLPSEFAGLASLEHIFVRESRLSGEIPAWLASLDALEYLYLEGNDFTGCIPAGLRDVENHDLDLLGLSYCGSTGQ